MSKPPISSPVAQTISGALMPGTLPSRADRWRPRILWALAIVFGALTVLMVVQTRADRAARQATYIAPALSAAEQSAADTRAIDKAISDAGAAEQARSDDASASAAAEARRTQDPSRELVKRSE